MIKCFTTIKSKMLIREDHVIIYFGYPQVQAMQIGCYIVTQPIMRGQQIVAKRFQGWGTNMAFKPCDKFFLYLRIVTDRLYVDSGAS